MANFPFEVIFHAIQGGIINAQMRKCVPTASVVYLHVRMICACFCRCLSLLYCFLSADMSTVSRSLSTFCCDGPNVETAAAVFGLKRPFLDGDLGDLNTAEMPNVAATAIFSSSSSFSSSSLKVKQRNNNFKTARIPRKSNIRRKR